MTRAAGSLRIYLQTPPSEGGTIRFCQLFLQPDLLGGWTVVRESGQQGGAGRIRRDHFAQINDAEAALMQERDRLLQRGYRIVFAQGAERP